MLAEWGSLEITLSLSKKKINSRTFGFIKNIFLVCKEDGVVS